MAAANSAALSDAHRHLASIANINVTDLGLRRVHRDYVAGRLGAPLSRDRHHADEHHIVTSQAATPQHSEIVDG